MIRYYTTRVECVKIGDIVSTIAGHIGMVVRNPTHINGVGVMLIGNYGDKGKIIDLRHDDFVERLDADFYQGDECIYRTWNTQQERIT